MSRPTRTSKARTSKARPSRFRRSLTSAAPAEMHLDAPTPPHRSGLRLAHRLGLAGLLGGALAACGPQPVPSLDAQRAVVQRAPRSPSQQAELGLWHWLMGDVAAARGAFEAAGDQPRAALGRALLALDALDAATAYAEARRAAAAEDPLVARLGLHLAEQAARDLSARDRAEPEPPPVEGGSPLAEGGSPPAERGSPKGGYPPPKGGSPLAESGSPKGGYPLTARPENPSNFSALRTPLAQPRSTVRVSFLPHLDLRRLAAKAPKVQGDTLEALDQIWALSPGMPTPDAEGVVITLWPLPAGTAEVEVEAEGPLLAWRDGRPLRTPDLDHLPPARARFAAPGQGPLVLAWSHRAVPRAYAWRLAPAGPPGEAPPVPGHRATPHWPTVALLAELALLDGDPEAAAAHLAPLPATPGLHGLRARVARTEPGRPDNLARDAARAAWTAALPVAPARAHLALGTLALEVGEAERALEHLQQARAHAPQAAAVHATLARAALTAGQTVLARAALATALERAPDPCGLVDLRAAVLDAEAVGPGRLAVVPDLVRCRQPLKAAERLLDAHQPERAVAVLDAAAAAGTARPPAKARRLRARALLATGDRAGARALLDPAADADDALLALDLDLAADPQAPLTAVAHLHRLHPVSSAALEVAAAWPEASPFGPQRLDPEAAIAAYEATVPQPGPAVRVLDHSVLLFLPGGKSLRLVQEVLAIRSREAAETYGEISLPARARVVALHTRKADGRRVEAEETPEKDSVTLRDLAVGDYVVAAWMEPGDNGYLYDRGLLSARVFFQGVDLPIFHQRFEAFAPDGEPLTVHGLSGAPTPEAVILRAPAPPALAARAHPDASSAPPQPGETEPPQPSEAEAHPPGGTERPTRDGSGETTAGTGDATPEPPESPPTETPAPEAPAPEATAQASGTTAPPGSPVDAYTAPRQGVRLEVHQRPLVPREPDSPPAPLWLPSARVGRNVVLAEDLAWFRDRLLGKRRRTARFDAWARTAAGEGPRAARIKRLARAVREGIDDQSGLIDEEAPRALATGSGNRAQVLSAALESLGIEHKLVIGRTQVAVPLGPFMGVSDFAYPLLLIDRNYFDPGPERAEPGFFPATIAGGDALELWPAQGAADVPFKLPEGRSVADTRTVVVTAHWGADGKLRGEVTDTLTGQESIVVGHHLSRLDPDQRPRLVERLLVAAVGGGRVLALSDPTAQDPDGPLVLRYTFEADAGDDLLIGMFPVSPGRSHASLPVRRTALDISLPTRQTVTWQVTADRPFAVHGQEGDLVHHTHSHRLHLEADGKRLKAHSELWVSGGLIEPRDYPDFAAWARQVDDRERLRLKVCEGPCAPRVIPDPDGA